MDKPKEAIKTPSAVTRSATTSKTTDDLSNEIEKLQSLNESLRKENEKLRKQQAEDANVPVPNWVQPTESDIESIVSEDERRVFPLLKRSKSDSEELVSRSRTISQLREKTNLTEERRGSNVSSKLMEEGTVARKRCKIEMDTLTQKIDALKNERATLQSQVDLLRNKLDEQERSNTDSLRQLDKEYHIKIAELESRFAEREEELESQCQSRLYQLEELEEKLKTAKESVMEEQLKHASAELLAELDGINRSRHAASEELRRIEQCIRVANENLNVVRSAVTNGEAIRAQQAAMQEQVTLEIQKASNAKQYLATLLTIICCMVQANKQSIERRAIELDQQRSQYWAYVEAVSQRMEQGQASLLQRQKYLNHKENELGEVESKLSARSAEYMHSLARNGGKIKYERRLNQERRSNLQAEKQQLTGLQEKHSERVKADLAELTLHTENTNRELERKAETLAVQEKQLQEVQRLCSGLEEQVNRREIELNARSASLAERETKHFDLAEKNARLSVLFDHVSQDLEVGTKKFNDQLSMALDFAKHLGNLLRCRREVKAESSDKSTPIQPSPAEASAEIPKVEDLIQTRALAIKEHLQNNSETLEIIKKTIAAVDMQHTKLIQSLSSEQECKGMALAESLRAVQDRAEKLKTQVSDHKNELSALEAKLREKKAEFKKCENDINEKQTALEDIRKQTVHAEQDKIQAEKEKATAYGALDAIKSEKDRWEKEQMRVRSELEEATTERDAQRNEVLMLTERKQQIQGDIDMLTRRLAAVEREKCDTEDSMKMLKSKYEAVQKRMAEADAQLNTVLSRLSYQVDVSALDREISEKQSTSRHLDEMIQRQVNCIQKLEAQIEKAREVFKSTDSDWYELIFGSGLMPMAKRDNGTLGGNNISTGTNGSSTTPVQTSSASAPVFHPRDLYVTGQRGGGGAEMLRSAAPGSKRLFPVHAEWTSADNRFGFGDA